MKAILEFGMERAQGPAWTAAREEGSLNG